MCQMFWVVCDDVRKSEKKFTDLHPNQDLEIPTILVINMADHYGN